MESDESNVDKQTQQAFNTDATSGQFDKYQKVSPENYADLKFEQAETVPLRDSSAPIEYDGSFFTGETSTERAKGFKNIMLESIPGVSEATVIEEINQELKADSPNWYLIGFLGGIGVIGVLPGVGDVAANALRAGAKKATSLFDNVEINPNVVGSNFGNIKFRGRTYSQDEKKFTNLPQEIERKEVEDRVIKNQGLGEYVPIKGGRASSEELDASRFFRISLDTLRRRRIEERGTLADLDILSFHGTASVFDQFDVKFIGSGTSQDTQSRGIYLSSLRFIGKNYREDQISRKLGGHYSSQSTLNNPVYNTATHTWKLTPGRRKEVDASGINKPNNDPLYDLNNIDSGRSLTDYELPEGKALIDTELNDETKNWLLNYANKNVTIWKKWQSEHSFTDKTQHWKQLKDGLRGERNAVAEGVYRILKENMNAGILPQDTVATIMKSPSHIADILSGNIKLNNNFNNELIENIGDNISNKQLNQLSSYADAIEELKVKANAVDELIAKEIDIRDINRVPSAGMLAEVKINALVARLGNWDKPISKQNDIIKNAFIKTQDDLLDTLKQFRSSVSSKDLEAFDKSIAEIGRQKYWAGIADDPSIIKRTLENIAPRNLPLGAIFNNMRYNFRNIKHLVTGTKKDTATTPDALKNGLIETFLEKHGMQGVKYTPGQIHQPGGWTQKELRQESNYVIYDAKLLEIVKKNLGMVAAPSIVLTAKSMSDNNEEGI